MKLPDSLLSILVLVSIGLALTALAVALFRNLRGKGPRPQAAAHDERLDVVVETQKRAITRLEDAVRRLAANERRLGEMLEGAIQHVAVVRFDAFEDMGGRLSFSAALLDSHADGVVITSINGRQEARCYAKRVERGTSIHNLSDEEEQAIREALSVVPQATTVEAR